MSLIIGLLMGSSITYALSIILRTRFFILTPCEEAILCLLEHNENVPFYLIYKRIDQVMGRVRIHVIITGLNNLNQQGLLVAYIDAVSDLRSYKISQKGKDKLYTLRNKRQTLNDWRVNDDRPIT